MNTAVQGHVKVHLAQRTKPKSKIGHGRKPADAHARETQQAADDGLHERRHARRPAGSAHAGGDAFGIELEKSHVRREARFAAAEWQSSRVAATNTFPRDRRTQLHPASARPAPKDDGAVENHEEHEALPKAVSLRDRWAKSFRRAPPPETSISHPKAKR
jgi:hypothetical protein